MSSASHGLFADRLREVREKLRLTQAEVGERSGLQAGAINHFEAGRRSPSFDNLKRLADALEVSVDYLLGRTEAAHPSALIVDLEEIKFRDKRANLSDDSKKMLNSFIEMLAKKDHDARPRKPKP